MPSPRALSLFSHAQVQKLFKKAQRVLKISGLVVLCSPAEKNYGRILVVTPAAVGNAPERNKIRRQIKAIFYEHRLFTRDYDVIVLIRKEAIDLNFKELETLIFRALENARVKVPLPLEASRELPPKSPPFIPPSDQENLRVINNIDTPKEEKK
jgi:ribonuclease P protein component